MKHLLAILVLISGAALFISSSSPNEITDETFSSSSYRSDWDRVDSLEKKGLFRMALHAVDSIFQKASDASNHIQVIKSVLYELRYNSYLEEDDYVYGIYRLNDLAKRAPSPSKEILHSLIAEVYWGYYSANSWKFANRTHLTESDLKDVRTWDLTKIAQAVRYHYFMSLTNQHITKSKTISSFSEIVSYAYGTSEIQPTLFDFLAHRALNFTMYSSFPVPGPAEIFAIDDEAYFGSNSTFLSIKPQTKDSLNTSFYAVQIFQELTRFHQEENNLPALFSVELERLRHMSYKSSLPNKDDLYYNSLHRLIRVYHDIPYVSEAWYELAVLHNSKGDTYNHLGDTTHRWDKKIAVEICKKTVECYGNAYGAEQCAALNTTIKFKDLNITGEEAVIPGVTSKISVRYKNIDKIYLKIVPCDYKKYNKGNFDHEKFVKRLRRKKGIHTKEIHLINPGDYQNHSTEIQIPGLDKGFYFIVASTSADFSEDEKYGFTYTPLWVTNITYQVRKSGNQQQVLVSNRTTGEPLKGATASVTSSFYNYENGSYEQKNIGNFTCDENGLFSFDAGSSQAFYSGNYYINVTHNDDNYEPNLANYSYASYEYDYPTTTHFFTDRKIYRPGQTIFFKGISVNNNGKERSVAKNQKSTVVLFDNNSQVIAKKEVVTNKFGSFEGSFTAPYDVLTGNMTISNAYGSTYLRVEEYKRPKFNIEMKPVEGELMVYDKVTAVGTAQAYAGNKIDGATVKYRVTRSTGYNWSYYSYWWQPYNEPKEIQHGEVITDENGEFEINFTALPDKTVDPNDLPIFTYTIYVDVTDVNGETHSSSVGCVVGYQTLKLGNNLTSEMNNQDDYFLRLSATNLNGQKIPATGKVIVTKLKMPDRTYYPRSWEKPDMPLMRDSDFKKLFPLEPTGKENDLTSWPKDKKVFECKFDTEITDSIVISNYNTWEPGAYIYEAFSKDKNGILVKDLQYFTVFDPRSTSAPTNDVLWVYGVQSTVEPGDTAEILIATKEKNVSVLYDIEVDNKIVETKRIVLNDEQIKLSIPVLEEHRGNFTVHFTTVKNNRKFGQSTTIFVPYTNKELDLSFSVFRDKLLPGAEEEWTLTIHNKKGEAENAELLASLYDASLDELYSPNYFYMNIYQTYYGSAFWGNGTGMNLTYGSNINYYWNEYEYYPSRTFPALNYHGYSTYYYGRAYYGYDFTHDLDPGYDYQWDSNQPTAEAPAVYFSDVTEVTNMSANASWDFADGSNAAVTGRTEALISTMDGLGGKDANLREQDVPAEHKKSESGGEGKNMDLSNIVARSNFNETAFFYPQLTTDANGDIKIKFTIPEALTKWRFLGLAHTQDLKIGTIEKDVITQKDLMVVPNVPRFFREGDKITIAAKISNISKENLDGRVQLDLIDPYTETSLNEKFNLKIIQLDFKADAGKSTYVSWSFDVPYELNAVKYKIVAAAGNFSDGEENVIPILSNRMLVTESMPMPLRGEENKTFHFEKLENSSKSKTLKHHRYTLEFTSNPAWYAVQAMPYMMEFPYECAEQTFTRYYSNVIAAHIMNSNPKIKTVIEAWGNESPEAFLSNLQKNEELKELILQETPWVLEAQSEEQSKRNLSVLLDMNRMAKESEKALTKIMNAQTVNGGWSWFPGMRENRYITQHIITGMGHLDHLGIKDVRSNPKVWLMVVKGIYYLDQQIVLDFHTAKKYDKNYKTNQHIGYDQIQYLYTRSYFPELPFSPGTTAAVKYYKRQAKKYWLNFNMYGEGMIALAAHRFEMPELANDIVKSLKDRSIHHEEFGMYWKEYQTGYYWYEAPIETQALMIEMFDEVSDDQESVDELKIWLLKQKQTTNWKTTKQTTEAVYALLLKGSNLLASDDIVDITVGGQSIENTKNPDPKNPYQVNAQAGTGYFKTTWAGEQVKSEMGEIKVNKKTKGVAWGAAYWQYFEDLDQITFAETPLALQKQLYLVAITDNGEQLKPINDKNVLHVGDKIRVRIVLKSDRDLEYVHMKDMRASGFEPINVLSTYKYQDGLGYYQATKDAATNFFFDYIPKGTYVFEYDLRVAHKGDFSNGITTIQCMYAPEFTSHSEGIRVVVQ